MSLAWGSKDRIRRSDIGVFPRRVACYTSLALGLKDRIRRSDIEVFPKRSFVIYVPSTRVHESVPVRLEWLAKKMIFYGSVPVCSVLLPRREFMWEYAGLSCLVLKNELIVEAYRFVRLNFQKRFCIERIWGLPAWLSKMISCGSVQVCPALLLNVDPDWECTRIACLTLGNDFVWKLTGSSGLASECGSRAEACRFVRLGIRRESILKCASLSGLPSE